MVLKYLKNSTNKDISLNWGQYCYTIPANGKLDGISMDICDAFLARFKDVEFAIEEEEKPVVVAELNATGFEFATEEEPKEVQAEAPKKRRSKKEEEK